MNFAFNRNPESKVEQRLLYSGSESGSNSNQRVPGGHTWAGAETGSLRHVGQPAVEMLKQLPVAPRTKSIPPKAGRN